MHITIQFSAVQENTLQNITVLCGTIPHITVQQGTVRYLVFAEVPRLAGSYSPPSSGSPVVRGARVLRMAGPEGNT